MLPAMPIALIAIATILGIEFISRRYNKNSLAKHQKRQAFDKMTASADNEQARADIGARRRKMEDKKVKRKGRGKGKGKGKGGPLAGDMGKQGRMDRVRGRLAGGRMRRGNGVVGSDGYKVVDATREWEGEV